MPSVIESGTIKEKYRGISTCKRDYAISLLNETHLPQMMKLQQIIVDNLQQPDLLATFSEAFMKRHLSSQGFAVGVFVNGKLVAFRNIYYPDRDDRQWNLGIDLGLEATQRSKVANLQMVCVHPRYRGNALAAKMNRVCLQRLRREDKYHHICATVSPYNHWNIRVLMNSGFHIAAIKHKYGGKLRYVVYQNLSQPVDFAGIHQVQIPLENITMQKKILRADYYGVALKQRDAFVEAGKALDADGFNIVFKRCMQKSCESQPIVIPNLWGRFTPNPQSENSHHQVLAAC